MVPTIIKHKNDLFDWLFEQKFASEITSNDTKLLHSLILCSVKNENTHSLIEIVDKDYDLAPIFDTIIEYASSNGFYTIIQMIHIVPKEQQILNSEIIYVNIFHITY